MLQGCNYLDAMGQVNDLYAIQQLLVSSQVLPANAGEVATMLLPNLAGECLGLGAALTHPASVRRALWHSGQASPRCYRGPPHRSFWDGTGGGAGR